MMTRPLQDSTGGYPSNTFPLRGVHSHNYPIQTSNTIQQTRNEYSDLTQSRKQVYVSNTPSKSASKKHRVHNSNQLPITGEGKNSTNPVTRHQQEYFEYQKNLSSPATIVGGGSKVSSIVGPALSKTFIIKNQQKQVISVDVKGSAKKMEYFAQRF